MNRSLQGPATPSSRLWLWVLLGWVAESFFRVFLDPRTFMADDLPSPTLSRELGSALVWTLITLALIALARHPSVERAAPLRWIGVHTLATLGVIVVRTLFIAFSDPWLRWYPSPTPLPLVFMNSITNNFVAGWLLIGVAHAVVQSQKSRLRAGEIASLRASLATAQLDALRARLNPHFIFNALNSVAETMHRDVPRADHMLVSLSALLRDGLSSDTRTLRPLREEVTLARHYLTMEQARLDTRLRVVWHLEPQALDCAVPVLLLQPLVENAILHGIAPFTEPGDLWIEAGMTGGALLLRVQNSVGVDNVPPRSSGTGNSLRGLRERLRLLYDGAARMSADAVQSEAGQGRYRVAISIPCATQQAP